MNNDKIRFYENQQIHLEKKPVSVTSGVTLLNDWKFDTTKNLLEVTIGKKSD